MVVDPMGRKHKRQKPLRWKRESESEGPNYSPQVASTMASSVVAGKRRR
jgi:hypothetical protein